MNICSLCYLTGEISEWRSNYFGCNCLIGGVPLYTCLVCHYIDNQPIQHLIIPLHYLSVQNNLSMETEENINELKEILKLSITLN